MKKYLSVLLCFSMVVSALAASLAFRPVDTKADDAIAEQETVIESKKAYAAPIIGGVIDSNLWGAPAISVTKDSYNAFLYRYNATPEDSNRDIYTVGDD